MSIIVTGGAGFIGSHLVDFLIKNTTENMIIYDNFSRGLHRNIEQHKYNSKISIIDGDINDEDLLKDVIKKNDIVFHLAAEASVLGSIKNEDLTFSTNVIGTYKILETSKNAKVNKIIFTSSREVYGEGAGLQVGENFPLNPKNAYGLSKVIDEMYCDFFRKEHNMDIRVLRLANVYGERDLNRVIPIWINNAFNGRPLKVFGGDQIIDFIHVSQVVRALWATSIKDEFVSPINIGSGIGTSIISLAEKICRMSKIDLNRIEFLPSNSQEVRCFIADVTKMNNELNIRSEIDPLFALSEMMLKQYNPK